MKTRKRKGAPEPGAEPRFPKILRNYEAGLDRENPLVINDDDDDDLPRVAGSFDAPIHIHDDQETVQCIACVSDIPIENALLLSCEHRYCTDCITTFFVNAIRNESFYPPKCCSTNLPDKAKDLIKPPTRERYEKKCIEYSVPARERVYCHVPTCSAFLHPRTITRGKALCMMCRATTCGSCKEGYTRGHKCAETADDRALIALGKENKWRQCSQCKGMVELSGGCNHITCHCGHHFCYVCGADWIPRTCHCHTWQPYRLAMQHARNNPANLRPNNFALADRQMAIAEIRYQLENAQRFMEHLNVRVAAQGVPNNRLAEDMNTIRRLRGEITELELAVERLQGQALQQQAPQQAPRQAPQQAPRQAPQQALRQVRGLYIGPVPEWGILMNLGPNGQ